MFLVKGKNNTTYALKRMYVNNEQDLCVAKREIQITVRFIVSNWQTGSIDDFFLFSLILRATRI